MTNDNRQGDVSDFSRGVHDYYARYIDNADAKIGGIVTLNVAVAGLLLANLPEACSPRVVAWIAVGAHVLAVIAGLYGIFPRLPSNGTSLIFWEDVRRMSSASEYADSVQTLDPAAAERAYATNNFYVAGVLHRKFLGIQLALIATCVALAAEGVSLALR